MVMKLKSRRLGDAASRVTLTRISGSVGDHIIVDMDGKTVGKLDREVIRGGIDPPWTGMITQEPSRKLYNVSNEWHGIWLIVNAICKREREAGHDIRHRFNRLPGGIYKARVEAHGTALGKDVY